MRDIHPDQAPYWLGGILEAISVDGGPTDQQLRLIQALVRGYFGFEESIELGPVSPDELASRITDPGSRYRLVQTLIVLALCRHPASGALSESIARYASALGVDEPMLQVARRAAEHSRKMLMADWARFKEPIKTEPRLTGISDDEFAARIDRLRGLAPGTLGRRFIDFYEYWKLDLPTNSDPNSLTLVRHDFAHLISGYQPNDAVDEVALSAMLVSCTNGDEHFSTLVESLALYEVNLFDIPGIEGTKKALDRRGSPEVFAEALRRGAACTHDIATFDHLGIAEWPLEEGPGDVRGSASAGLGWHLSSPGGVKVDGPPMAPRSAGSVSVSTRTSTPIGDVGLSPDPSFECSCALWYRSH